jgi:hypothetical protein
MKTIDTQDSYNKTIGYGCNIMIYEHTRLLKNHWLRLSRILLILRLTRSYKLDSLEREKRILIDVEMLAEKT